MFDATIYTAKKKIKPPPATLLPGVMACDPQLEESQCPTGTLRKPLDYTSEAGKLFLVEQAAAARNAAAKERAEFYRQLRNTPRFRS